MKNLNDSPFSSLLRAIARFFGIDILIAIVILALPTMLFPWLANILGSLYANEANRILVSYSPYIATAVLFLCTALVRHVNFSREGLSAPISMNSRFFWGNLLVIATVAAIVLKRNQRTFSGELPTYERSAIAIDLLFIWVVANFVAQLILWGFNFYKSHRAG